MKMSLEKRTTSAMNERAEQLKRWYESDTNREPAEPKSSKRKIQFSPGCVFLAACAAADKDEVQFLLDHGADINTANVDGLTALHQACIDNNLDMVEFLVHNGANINQGDNEGWTPLHATSSCGFTSIAKFLLDNGADIAAVNIDGDLPCDICYLNEDMEELLFSEMQNQGVKEDEARRQEENQMYEDVKNYVSYKDNQNILKVNGKNEATALHVAASKSYLRVLDELLKSNCIDIDKQDVDGWTALHAAAHWGNSEACEMLIKHHADTEIKNNMNETVFDVARKKLLDKLRIWDQEQDKVEVQRRKSDRRRLEAKVKASEQPLLQSPSAAKVPKVSTDAIASNRSQSQTTMAVDKENIDRFSKNAIVSDVPLYNKPPHSVGGRGSSSSNSSVIGTSDNSGDYKETAQNSPLPRTVSSLNNENSLASQNSGNVAGNSNRDDRRSISHLNAVSTHQQPVAWIKPVSQNNRLLVVDNDDNSSKNGDNTNGMRCEPEVQVVAAAEPAPMTTPSSVAPSLVVKPTLIDSDISLRRTQSFESDKKFYLRYLELHARIKASSNPVVVSPATTVTPAARSAAVTVSAPTTTLPAPQPIPTMTTTTIGAAAAAAASVTMTSTTTTTATVPAERSFLTNNNISTNSVCNKLASSSNHFINSHSHSNSILTTNNNNNHNNNSSCTSSASTAPILSSTNASNSSLFRLAHSESNFNSNLSNKNEPRNDQSSQNVVTKSNQAGSAVSKLRPGTLIKNFFKSFVPPVRDEESETQRKAHAKRVRETRRSTQGVTLDEIKSAEELIKKQQQEQQQQQQENQKTAGNELSNGCENVAAKGSNESAAAVAEPTAIAQERRPSWRLRVDNGSKFALEDASKDPQPSSLSSSYTSSPLFGRRHSSLIANATGQSNGSFAGTSSSSSNSNGNIDLSSTAATTATVTLALRRQSDSTNNKPSLDSNAGVTATAAAAAAALPPSVATQAAIQRRRRPKRRSTGVVNVDLDDIINSENGQNIDKKDSDDEEPRPESITSTTTSTTPASARTNSNISAAVAATTAAAAAAASTEIYDSNSVNNGGNGNGTVSDSSLDYKKLWEESCLENGLLKDKLRKAEDELRDAKDVLERINSVTSKNCLSLSELEKREKRAMERKLSEMEEELKQLQKLKAENERLRTENKALTRVVNKLSNSTIK